MNYAGAAIDGTCVKNLLFLRLSSSQLLHEGSSYIELTMTPIAASSFIELSMAK